MSENKIKENDIIGEGVFNRGRRGIDFNGVVKVEEWVSETSDKSKHEIITLTLTSYDGNLEMAMHMQKSEFNKLLEQINNEEETTEARL